MKHNLAIFAFCFFVFSLSAQAQSWQWGARGGSSGNTSTDDEEFVKDIAVDKNGNIYVLANAGSQTGINIAGQAKTGMGREDIVLASFRCNGTLRWIKI